MDNIISQKKRQILLNTKALNTLKGVHEKLEQIETNLQKLRDTKTKRD